MARARGREPRVRRRARGRRRVLATSRPESGETPSGPPRSTPPPRRAGQQRRSDERRLRLPDTIARLDAKIARGERQAAVPRDAASVILLDDRGGSLDAFLLVRHATMAFAPGMAVFPGGSVDALDLDVDAALAGATSAEWAARLGLDERTTAALLCAAVRELFEETGVLLATRDGDFVEAQDPRWREIRRGLEAHELAFSQVIADHRLVLRTDLLSPWARWTTPRFEPRRFRVWFFVARLPDGQVARPVSTESVSAAWTPVARAVADADAGLVEILPPQYYSLAELSAEGAPGPGPSGDRTLPDVEPRVETDGDGAFLSLPPEILRHAPGAARPSVAQTRSPAHRFIAE